MPGRCCDRAQRERCADEQQTTNWFAHERPPWMTCRLDYLSRRRMTKFEPSAGAGARQSVVNQHVPPGSSAPILMSVVVSNVATKTAVADPLAAALVTLRVQLTSILVVSLIVTHDEAV